MHNKLQGFLVDGHRRRGLVIPLRAHLFEPSWGRSVRTSSMFAILLTASLMSRLDSEDTPTSHVRPRSRPHSTQSQRQREGTFHTGRVKNPRLDDESFGTAMSVWLTKIFLHHMVLASAGLRSLPCLRNTVQPECRQIYHRRVDDQRCT